MSQVQFSPRAPFFGKSITLGSPSQLTTNTGFVDIKNILCLYIAMPKINNFKIRALSLKSTPRQQVLINQFFDFLESLAACGLDISGLNYSQSGGGLGHHRFRVPNKLWGDLELWIAEGKYRRSNISFNSHFSSDRSYQRGVFDTLENPLTIRHGDPKLPDEDKFKISMKMLEGSRYIEPAKPSQFKKCLGLGLQYAILRRSQCEYTPYTQKIQNFKRVRLIRPVHDKYNIIDNVTTAIDRVWQYQPEILNQQDVLITIAGRTVKKPSFAQNISHLTLEDNTDTTQKGQNYTDIANAFHENVGALSDDNMRELGFRASHHVTAFAQAANETDDRNLYVLRGKEGIRVRRTLIRLADGIPDITDSTSPKELRGYFELILAKPKVSTIHSIEIERINTPIKSATLALEKV